MTKRTQAEKLKRALMWGTLQYEGPGPGAKNKFSFTPTQAGHEEKGIHATTMDCHSPYELIDVIFFEYLEKSPKKERTRFD